MKIMAYQRVLMGALLSASVLFAQAQSTGPLTVEDRSVSSSSRHSSGAGANQGASQDGLLVLMEQQEQFEQQIQNLQGQVEKLRHQLRRLKDAERERYLDLDTRINNLADQDSGPSPTDNPDGDDEPSRADSEAARKAYKEAKAKLIDRDFDAAAQAFQSYLNDYPQGQDRAYAHFYLGRVYRDLDEPQKDKARAQFQAVLDDYPEHSRAPASLYTLAVMQARGGQLSQAKVNLHKLIKQYPDADEASQAKTLLEKLDR